MILPIPDALPELAKRLPPTKELVQPPSTREARDLLEKATSKYAQHKSKTARAVRRPRHPPNGDLKIIFFLGAVILIAIAVSIFCIVQNKKKDEARKKLEAKKEAARAKAEAAAEAKAQAKAQAAK
ncbi:hypothetical protein FPOAC2_08653 [Fusarium poae]